VDFAVWLLFSRDKKGAERPRNLLCDGFRRESERRAHGKASATRGQIPGLFEVFTNNHVRALKQDPWPHLLLLLGKAGERIMIDLLLDCSIFSKLAAGRDNYQQLTGIPVSELDYHLPLLSSSSPRRISKQGANQVDSVRTPSEISFVRSRMLYARAALNAQGYVQFGLRHIRKFSLFSFLRMWLTRC
jgi:telomerase reverse transcriptase